MIGRFCRIAAAAAFCLSLGPPAHAEDLNAVLAAATAGTQVPAMSILTMQDGKIGGIAVRGVRRNDRPDPAGENDVWLLGSDAKPMTATLIAKLVDRHVLSWDAPLSAMLPDLAATMRPEYRNVTLVQLLTHRSGLPHDDSDMNFFMGFLADKRPAQEQRHDYIARALTEAPVAPPGTKYSYSNTGFIVAAAIAERATGTPYEELMRREIFGPLGMTSAGYGMTPDGQPQGHNGGKVATLADANPEMFAPAGNIYMSLRDWAAFCLDQMAGYHGGGKLLAPATYRMMETKVPGADTGLSWGVQDSLAGRQGPVLMHAGSDGNWTALVALFPETQNGVLVADNAGDDMDGEKAAKAALKAVLPDLAPAADASR